MSKQEYNVGEAGIVGEKINISGKFASGGDLQVKIGQYVEKNFEVQKYLTPLPAIPLNLVGRDSTLNQFRSALDEHSYIHLQGLPGLGKTVFLANYVHKNKDAFSHIAWIKGPSNITGSILAQLDPDLVGLEYGDMEKPAERISKLMFALQNIEGNNLFVLDHFNDPEELLAYREKLTLPANWKIVVTTRANLDNIPSVKIDQLSTEEGISLFRNYYKGEIIESELEGLLNEIRFNPVIIQIFAKLLQSSPSLKGVNQLVKILDGEDAPQVTKRGDSVSDSSTSELFKLLKEAFSLSELKDVEEERTCLKLFCLLPMGEYSMKELITLFQIKDEYVNALEGTISSLVSQGWLDNHSADIYSVNPVIRRMLMEQLSPGKNEANAILDSVTQIIYNNDLLDPAESLKFEPYLEILSPYIEPESIQQADYSNARGRLAMISGNYETALKHFESAESILEPMAIKLYFNPPPRHPFELVSDVQKLDSEFTKERVFLSKIYNNISVCEHRLGLITNAVHTQISAIKYLEGCPKEYEMLLSNYYDNATVLGLDLDLPDGLKAAESFSQKSLKIKKANPKTPAKYIALNLYNISNIRYAKKDVEGSLDYINQAIEEIQTEVEVNNPFLLKMMIQKGITESNLGTLKNPVVYCKEIIDKLAETLGVDHPDVAENNVILGAFYQNENNNEKALECYHQSIKTLEKYYDDKNAAIVKALTSIGLIHYKNEKYTEAIKHWDRALKANDSKFGGVHETIALNYSNLAVSYMMTKDYDQAEVHYKKAVETYRELGANVQDQVNIGIMYRNMRIHYKRQKKYELALHAAQKTVEINEKILGKDNPMVKADVYQVKAIEGRMMQQNFWGKIGSFLGNKKRDN